ncbi:hypothetical protein [Mycobacterium shigaense]|uniref:hypothetical protein n=1 Tax=Mycobacterium shigaense TaxID=722731 RepID=UPI000E567512|nr:hypothetical protein [Mycobacterium shigaense]
MPRKTIYTPAVGGSIPSAPTNAHGGDTVIDQTCRGAKHTAAQHFRTSLANDDRVHARRAVAAGTDARLLPTAGEARDHLGVV